MNRTILLFLDHARATMARPPPAVNRNSPQNCGSSWQFQDLPEIQGNHQDRKTIFHASHEIPEGNPRAETALAIPTNSRLFADETALDEFAVGLFHSIHRLFVFAPLDQFSQALFERNFGFKAKRAKLGSIGVTMADVAAAEALEDLRFEILMTVKFGEGSRERQDRGGFSRPDIIDLIRGARVFEQGDFGADKVVDADEIAQLLAVLIDDRGLIVLDSRGEDGGPRPCRGCSGFGAGHSN